MADHSDRFSVEVSFSPALYDHKLTKNNFTTVIVDVLRATTSICAALDHGVKAIIPAPGVDAAREYKTQGFIVACERDGKVLDFADLGNSPSDFLDERLAGKEVVFSTTNGTRAVAHARDAQTIVLGSFANLSALAEWLLQRKSNVVIFCAAWKKLFNLEDSVFAGALAEKLLSHDSFFTICDSVKASVGLWNLAKNDLQGYLSESSHRIRLKYLVSNEDFLYTVTPDTTRVIPVLKDNKFVRG